jgi:hypothetical protein
MKQDVSDVGYLNNIRVGDIVKDLCVDESSYYGVVTGIRVNRSVSNLSLCEVLWFNNEEHNWFPRYIDELKVLT